MSENNKKIVAAAAAVVMCIAGGAGYMKYSEVKAEEHRQVLEKREAQDAAYAASEAAAKAEKDKAWEEFSKKKIAEAGKHEKKPDKTKPNVTVSEDGKEVEITRPEYEKPQPPEKPTIPEDQKNDPSKKPEPVLPPAPPKKDTPQEGDRKTDSSGQEWIYNEMFGWFKPTGGEVTKSEMQPNGNIIGH